MTRFESAGFSDLAAGHRASPDTTYLWFSMTKIVTATATMQLAQEGTLELDEPVHRYLPEFPKREGWPTVEVRHLLSHSSGLSNPLPIRWVHNADEAGRDPKDFALGLLAKHNRLRFPAGSKAVYSNLGYLALGEVIREASGKPFGDYVRSRILDPLGMSSTGFNYRDDDGAEVAAAYQRRLHPMTPLFRLLLPRGIMGSSEDGYVRFNRFLVDGPPYGGLVGTVKDGARFVLEHLRGDQERGPRLLDAQGIESMQTLQASGRKLDVGYGWFRRGADRANGAFWEHLGGGGGFWCMMRIYSERGLGVLSMGNSTGYDHDSIARAALADHER